MINEFKKLGFKVVIRDLAKIIKKEVISIGDYSKIDDFAFIYGGKGITIGKYCHVCSFVSIIGGGELFMGDYSTLTAGVRLITGTNVHQGGYHMSNCAPREQQKVKATFIKIGKDAFIGTNSVIHPSVTIGEGAIIGSNSLVLKDVEPYTINVGSPCKKIGIREKIKDFDKWRLNTKEGFYTNGDPNVSCFP